MFDSSYAMFVRGDAPYSTLGKLAEYCKANPETLRIIASKNSSSGHLADSFEKALGGVSFRHIEGPSSVNEKLAGFLSGQNDILTGNYSLFKDYVAEGKIKCLGNYGSTNVPELEKQGIKSWKSQGYNYANDFVFMLRAKKGTDKKIIEKMEQALKKVSEDSEFVKSISVRNVTPKFLNGEGCLEVEKNYFEDSKKFLTAKGK